MSLNKPTIAYLLFNTKNNGGNRIIFEQANRLTRRGYQVKIYSLFSQKVNWFPLRIKIDCLLTSLFSKTGVLIATFWPTAYLAFFFRAKRKFYLIQGYEVDFYRNFLIKKLIEFTYIFPFKKIAISAFVEQQIKKYALNPSPIVRLNGSGIDHSSFKPRTSHLRSKQVKILSIVSSSIWAKGIDLLIMAVRKIKHLHPNYTFTLVSQENNPADPIFDRFISNPKTKQLVNLYQQSDILLATARSEGFFLPGLEAMACGCIFITTDSGGINEYAVNKKNCLILNNLDELWKKDLIAKLLTNNKLKKTLKQNGYETVKRYDWDRIIARLENIYLGQV